jgi:hypothetical protein
LAHSDQVDAKQEIGEIGDQSLNEQSIDQQIEQIEHLDGLTITVGPNI